MSFQRPSRTEGRAPPPGNMEDRAPPPGSMLDRAPPPGNMLGRAPPPGEADLTQDGRTSPSFHKAGAR